MKITSCISVFTFPLFLTFVDCSSLVPGSSSLGKFRPHPPQWVNTETHGYQVKVKRDPFNRSLAAIELRPEQKPLKVHQGNLRRYTDKKQDLDFVAQLDPHTGDWIAVAPMSAEFAANVPLFSGNDQQDRLQAI